MLQMRKSYKEHGSRKEIRLPEVRQQDILQAKNRNKKD